MVNKKVISVLSGGLDSTILTYKLVNEFGVDNVHALTFWYQQKHNIELEKAKLTCSKLGITHHIVDIGFLGDMVRGVSALVSGSDIQTPTIKESLGNPQPLSYIPNRNMILISIATAYAEAMQANAVYLGLQMQDTHGYFDTTSAFVEAINNVNILNRKNLIEIKAPFIELDKASEIKIGINLNVPFEDTWTCYSGHDEEGKACGKCLSCADRIGNFIKAGIKDPVPYQIDINWDNLIK